MADNDTGLFNNSVNITLVNCVNDTGYNTSGNGSPHTDNSVPILEIINWILFAVTIAVFIYGVISWCIIKKFRHFRNYVLLSAILANVLRFFVTVMTYIIRPESLKHPLIRLMFVCVFLYCVLTYNYWLLVLCYIFYVDFVKVFNTNIRRRYMKSSLFAWGVPLLSVTIYFMAFFYYYITSSRSKITRRNSIVAMLMLLMPVAINFVIYITVLCSLFRGSEAGASTSANKWRRFYISTLICVLSDAILVVTGLLQVIQIPFLFVDIVGELGEYLNIIALDIYLPAVKSNRELWREFVNKRCKQKSLEMK